MAELEKSPAIKQVYLDVCVLCRPFDDQHQMRIRLETNAVELILAHIRQGNPALIASPVHNAEIEAIPDPEERNHLRLLLQQQGHLPDISLTAARERAEPWIKQGMGVADAAHLAFAVEANADFVTVDDRLLKLCRRLNPGVWCGTPEAYCDKEDL
jgi:predicted nucleic acid-binding protein